MGLTLREILALEGQTKADGLKDALIKLEGHPYSSAFAGVVVIYKAAAMLRRLEEGYNVAEESIRLFDAFIEVMNQMIIDLGFVDPEDNPDDETPPPVETREHVIAALLSHNVASANAAVNADDPEMQRECNLWSLNMLNGVPEDQRDDDWHVVYEKVCAGLYEAGHIDWDEEGYNDLLRSMTERHSKDAAGRAAFLARKYMDASRIDEAVEVLAPVEKDDDWSAPNQKEAAMKLLATIRGIIASGA